MRKTLLFTVLFALVGCSKPGPISETHQGRIETGDTVLTTDNSLYDAYPFKAAEGMTITATMTSTEFDTYLHLIDSNGNQLAQNDDDATMGAGPNGAQTNSKITFTAPTTGDYQIYANAFRAGETGAYTLTITTTAAAQ
jgi:serine protease Do